MCVVEIWTYSECFCTYSRMLGDCPRVGSCAVDTEADPDEESCGDISYVRRNFLEPICDDCLLDELDHPILDKEAESIGSDLLTKYECTNRQKQTNIPSHAIDVKSVSGSTTQDTPPSLETDLSSTEEYREDDDVEWMTCHSAQPSPLTSTGHPGHHLHNEDIDIVQHRPTSKTLSPQPHLWAHFGAKSNPACLYSRCIHTGCGCTYLVVLKCNCLLRERSHQIISPPTLPRIRSLPLLQASHRPGNVPAERPSTATSRPSPQGPTYGFQQPGAGRTVGSEKGNPRCSNVNVQVHKEEIMAEANCSRCREQGKQEPSPSRATWTPRPDAQSRLSTMRLRKRLSLFSLAAGTTSPQNSAALRSATISGRQDHESTFSQRSSPASGTSQLKAGRKFSKSVAQKLQRIGSLVSLRSMGK